MSLSKTIKKNDDSNKIMGAVFFSGSEESLLKKLHVTLDNPATTPVTIIFTPNPEQLVLAHSDDTFSSILNRSTYNIADGVGIVWASRRIAKKKNSDVQSLRRITGVDVLQELTLHTLMSGQKVLFLGGQDDIANKAKQQLLTKPELQGVDQSQIVTSSGYKSVQNPTDEEEQALAALISEHQPSVVFVGFGAPFQEQWIIEHKSLLEGSKVKIAMVVGGAFDIVANKLPRAPFIWRKIGLEWLWRLLLQPSRWRRQLRLVKFVWLVLTNKTKPTS